MYVRKLQLNEVKFTLSIEPEEISVRGNYMATDDDVADKAAEDDIINRINNGDNTAWCCLVMTAEWSGYKKFASLGGCSFSENTTQEEIMELEGNQLREEALDSLNYSIYTTVTNLVNNGIIRE